LRELAARKVQRNFTPAAPSSIGGQNNTARS
jgi:hypothetical protein